MNPIFVLLVDDEAPFLEAIVDSLSVTDEFTFDTALSAEEALEKLSNTQYDVIVSDYSMADNDGIWLFQQIRKFTFTPFILFTGNDDEQLVIEAINHGINYYLRKGRDPEILFAELSHMIYEGACTKQFEDRLQELEQKYQSLFENSVLPTYIYDPIGDCSDMNAAALTFREMSSDSDFMNRNLFQLPGMIPELVDRIQSGEKIVYSFNSGMSIETQNSMNNATMKGIRSIEISIFSFKTLSGCISAYCAQIRERVSHTVF